MNDRTREPCARVDRLLALGESPWPADLQRHVTTCAACGREVAAYRHLLAAVAAGADVAPPAVLDARVRAALRAGPGGVLRPVVATGLAIAGLLALIGALGTWLAQAGAAELGPLYACALASIYLALSFAASLPLLLHRQLRRSRRRVEVGR